MQQPSYNGPSRPLGPGEENNYMRTTDELFLVFPDAFETTQRVLQWDEDLWAKEGIGGEIHTFLGSFAQGPMMCSLLGPPDSFATRTTQSELEHLHGVRSMARSKRVVYLAHYLGVASTLLMGLQTNTPMALERYLTLGSVEQTANHVLACLDLIGPEEGRIGRYREVVIERLGRLNAALVSPNERIETLPMERLADAYGRFALTRQGGAWVVFAEDGETAGRGPTPLDATFRALEARYVEDKLRG